MRSSHSRINVYLAQAIRIKPSVSSLKPETSGLEVNLSNCDPDVWIWELGTLSSEVNLSSLEVETSGSEPGHLTSEVNVLSLEVETSGSQPGHLTFELEMSSLEPGMLEFEVEG